MFVWEVLYCTFSYTFLLRTCNVYVMTSLISFCLFLCVVCMLSFSGRCSVELKPMGPGLTVGSQVNILKSYHAKVTPSLSQLKLGAGHVRFKHIGFLALLMVLRKSWVFKKKFFDLWFRKWDGFFLGPLNTRDLLRSVHFWRSSSFVVRKQVKLLNIS